MKQIIIRGLCNLLSVIMLFSLAGCAETPAVKEEEKLLSLKNEGVLSVLTCADYEPYEYYDQEGKLCGKDVELMRSAAEGLGLEIEITVTEFPLIAKDFEGGAYDLLWAALDYEEELAEKYEYLEYGFEGSDYKFYIYVDSENELLSEKLKELI